MLENVGVSDYINELSEKLKDERIMTAKDRQVMLSDIARNIGYVLSECIKVVNMLNKMTGEYTVKVNKKVIVIKNLFISVAKKIDHNRI